MVQGNAHTVGGFASKTIAQEKSMDVTFELHGFFYNREEKKRRDPLVVSSFS